MSQIFSRAFIRVGGVLQSSLPGSLKFNPGGDENTPVVNDDRTVDFTSKPVHSEIEFDVSIKGDIDIVALGKAGPQRITIEGDSGHSWVCDGCILAAPINVQSGDGKASLKYFGSPAVQG